MSTTSSPEPHDGPGFEEMALYLAVGVVALAYGLHLLGVHVPILDEVFTDPASGHLLQLLFLASIGLIVPRLNRRNERLRSDIARLQGTLDGQLPELARHTRQAVTTHVEDVLLRAEDRVSPVLRVICPEAAHTTFKRARELATLGVVSVTPGDIARYYQAILTHYPGDRFLAVAAATEDVWDYAGVYDFMDTFINRMSPRGRIERVFIVGNAAALQPDEVELLRKHQRINVSVRAVSAQLTKPSDADTLFLLHADGHIALTATLRNGKFDRARVTTDPEEIAELLALFTHLYGMALDPKLD